jgi:hypothetical protein
MLGDFLCWRKSSIFTVHIYSFNMENSEDDAKVFVPYSKRFNKKIFEEVACNMIGGKDAPLYSKQISRHEFESSLKTELLKEAYLEEYAEDKCSFIKIKEDCGIALLMLKNGFLVLAYIIDLKIDPLLQYRKM